MMGLALSASAQKPRIITFDAPGAGSAAAGQGTFPYDINTEGAITGEYGDAGWWWHGFVRTPDGRIKTFDAPGTSPVANTGTQPISINPAGAIAGSYWYYQESGPYGCNSFLRAPDGTFTTFEAPGALWTYAGNINPAGTIAGDYQDTSYVYHGFVRAPDAVITPFDVTPTFPDPAPGTEPWQGTYTSLSSALNPEGAITGYYIDAGWVYHGFVRAPDGRFKTFDAPGVGTTEAEMGTYPQSINPEGTITGYFWDANWVGHGFLRTRDGRITTFDAPGAGADPGSTEGTFPMAINANGTITGYLQDTKWLTHGFSRSPDGKFTTFDVPGEGTVPGTWEGTWPMRINANGTITGGYNDSSGVYHGFLRIP
jgi:hypothetical protein